MCTTIVKKNAKKRYKLIIFDFDGTLADSVPDIWNVSNLMAKEYKIKSITKKKVVESVGAGLDIFLKKIFPSILKTKSLPLLKEKYVNYFAKAYKQNVKLFPGVFDTLDYIKEKNIKMIIVSNKEKKLVEKTCEYLKIKKYFLTIAGRGDLKKDKPDAYPILYMMKKYKAKKGEVLFVGDSKYDIEAASNAGVNSVYLTYGYGKLSDMKKYKPSFVFSKIKRLRELI